MSAVCRYNKDELHRVPDAEALHVSRFQGGDYRRPSKWYRTTICREHALTLMDYPPNRAGGTVDGYGYRTLRRALGLDKAEVEA